MRFATSSQHREFFTKHHYIEFDELIDKKDIESLKKHADLVLAKRLRLSLEALNGKTPQELWMAGRDVWRDDPLIKKTVLRTQLAEIAGSLVHKNALRIAYDQYARSFFPSETEPTKALTLQQMSSFQSVSAGLILQLSSSPSEPPASDYFCPYPKDPGSAVFFTADHPLSFAPLLHMKDASLLIIVYCNEKTVYKLEKNDLHTHALKKEGYAFGDLLTNSTHPIVLS